jgi:peptide/nickel transport system substrate-binding protein
MARLALILLALAAALPAQAAKVIRIAPQSNLAVLDPFWTTATVTRTHGYMIYDTLFGTDAESRIRPQMVDTWNMSKDGKTWTFTLRKGLVFSDGQPVTSRDVIASLERWAKRDTLGQKLAAALERWEEVDARTFRLHLKHPFGLVLEALGKQGANVPFILPARVAATPIDKQIDDTTGSGPYIFDKAAWRPGALVVYRNNPLYKPRPEPPSGTAGGKRVYVDRVEWHILPDAQTQVNALLKGEIDLVEQPAHEHYPRLRADPHIRVYDNRYGAQVLLRFNHLQPPFSDLRLRRAALVALSQEPFLKAQYVSPDLYRGCRSMYPCDTPYQTDAGMQGLLRGDIKRARAMLKAAGYDGTPVVIMQPTDLATIARLPVVAAQQLRQAGFKVQLQSMDWQTLVSRRQKKGPPAEGGWNVFITTFNGLDLANPVVNPAMNASCAEAWPGWPCDAKLETLRGEFLQAKNETEKKRLAALAQVRALEIGTHAPLGEYFQPVAARDDITGYLNAPVYVYWNLDKK